MRCARSGAAPVAGTPCARAGAVVLPPTTLKRSAVAKEGAKDPAKASGVKKYGKAGMRRTAAQAGKKFGSGIPPPLLGGPQR